MQLLKFYGRTMNGAMAQVRRALGPDALILQTRTVKEGSAEERLNPGARVEIQAVRDLPARTSERVGARTSSSGNEMVGRSRTGIAFDYEHEHAREHTTHRRGGAERRLIWGHSLLEDLGILRAQIRELLEADGGARGAEIVARGLAEAERVDWSDYYSLIHQGFDHRILAPHLREWLAWRTAPPALRRLIAQRRGGAAAAMKGESLREWLWLTWLERQGVEPPGAQDRDAATGSRRGSGPVAVGLVGPTGAGKTTTLAKMASISRQKHMKNAIILTLDTMRYGATEQWRRYARLMDVPVQEIATQSDLSVCMEKWGNFDWIGIDTPGGLTPESEIGRRYGSILAQCPQVETLLLLTATNSETFSRDQMERGRTLGASKVIFSKLDETARLGSLVNLTMDGRWKVEGLTTGPRIPDDWDPGIRQTAWQRIFAAGADPARMGGAA